MTAVDRGVQHDTDVLINQVERCLARMRTGHPDQDLDLAERIAACLRALIVGTAQASAADRARVRAAVRYFVVRRGGHGSGPAFRSFLAEQRVVNDVARQLGRPDLLVRPTTNGLDPEGTEPDPC